MTLSNQDARSKVEVYREYLEKRFRWIDEGEIDGEASGPLYSIASGQESLARSLSILGQRTEARRTFADAATTYCDHIDACWREGPESDNYIDLPVMVTKAIKCGLLGNAAESITRAVTHAKRVQERLPSDFAPGSSADDQDRFNYYSAQLWAAAVEPEAMTLDEEIVSEHREISKSVNPSALVPLNDALTGLLREDADLTRNGIRGRLEYHEAEFESGDHSVYDAVAMTVGAFIVLARRRSIDVQFESECLPPALLPEEPRTDGGSAGAVPDPMANVTLEWNEETGALLLIGEVTHEEDRDLNVSDLPTNEYGTIPTADWYESVQQVVAETPDVVGPAIREALEAGTVERKVVVHQPQSNHHLFDESFRDIDVGEVEFIRT